MRCFKRFCRTAAALAFTVVGSHVAAQDTLSISGTFGMDVSSGIVGDDLAQVYGDRFDHGWTLTLYGVTYSYDYLYDDAYDEFGYLVYYEEQRITRVHAASFDLQFFGPDADILNQVLSDQLTGGSLTDGACLELVNYDYFDAYDEFGGYSIAIWTIGLAPADSNPGVSFSALGGTYPLFSLDANGFPVFAPKHLQADHIRIRDRRPGNDGSLLSYYDVVDFGSSVPPYLPPALVILDGSVLEGNRSTTRLNLIVTLSQYASSPITVNYATADGTASRKSDYTARSGTLTFQPGQSEATIPLAIKGDRKREPDESFTVRLFSAMGATISDGVATVTILNDD